MPSQLPEIMKKMERVQKVKLSSFRFRDPNVSLPLQRGWYPRLSKQVQRRDVGSLWAISTISAQMAEWEWTIDWTVGLFWIKRSAGKSRTLGNCFSPFLWQWMVLCVSMTTLQGWRWFQCSQNVFKQKPTSQARATEAAKLISCN